MISPSHFHYHPQRNWGKVIFSEACLKNSVHRGRGGSSGPHPGGRLRDLAGGDGLQAQARGGEGGRELADGYCCGRYASY